MSSGWDLVKEVLPTIATALGGPFAGMVVDAVTSHLGLPPQTTETLKQVLSGMSPDALVKLKEVEANLQIKLTELGYENVQKLEELNVRVIESINTTIQTEAKADHWPTYSWRPFIGFMFGSYIGSMWLLPLFHITPVTLNPDLTFAVGGILGVASWFRGKMQANPDINSDKRG